MKVEPINRTNISEQVFEQMKRLIIEGEWKPGEKLPSENDLAKTFEVSRITIRHALQKLTVLGLLETKFGEGSFVKEVEMGSFMNSIIPAAYLTPRNTLEVLDFRRVIEVETAGLAAERATDLDVEELVQQFETMEKARDEAWEFALADLDFHFMIAKITRNSLIIATFGILRDVLEACMKDTVEILGIEVGIPYHKRLLRAFANRDSESAKQIMREHMDSTKEQFKKLGQP